MDRKKSPLSTKKVAPKVEPVAEWIYNTYGSLKKNQFETDKSYLAELLEEYQKV